MTHIAVIGYARKDDFAYRLAIYLREIGAEVSLIAANLEGLAGMDTKADVTVHLLQFYAKTHNINEVVEMHETRGVFPMAELLPTLGHPPAVFINIQHDFLLDFAGVEIPVIEYHTEILRPVLPLNARLKAIFYAYRGGDEILQEARPEQCIGVPVWYLPYCFMSHDFRLEKDPRDRELIHWASRKITWGFKGSLSYLGGGTFHPWKRAVYESRVKWVQFARRIGLHFEAPDNPDVYWKFMLNTQVAFNVVAADRGANERTFLAPGLGCILLQYVATTSKGFVAELGLQSGVNCLLFSTKLQLIWRLLQLAWWRRMNRRKMFSLVCGGLSWALWNTEKARFEKIISVLNYLCLTDKLHGETRHAPRATI